MILENDWLLANPVVSQEKKLSDAMSIFALAQLCCWFASNVEDSKPVLGVKLTS